MFPGGDDLTLREKCFDLPRGGNDVVDSCLLLAKECDQQRGGGETDFSLTLPGASSPIVYDSYEACGQAATGISAAFDANRITGVRANREASKAYFKAAVRFFDAEKYPEAIEQFEHAYNLFPSPRIRGNIERIRAQLAPPTAAPASAETTTPRVVKVAAPDDLAKLTTATIDRPVVIVLVPRSYEKAQAIQDRVVAQDAGADVYVIHVDDVAVTTPLVAGLKGHGVALAGQPEKTVRLYRRDVNQANYVQVDGRLEPMQDYFFQPVSFGNFRSLVDDTTKAAVLLIGDREQNYLLQKKIRKAMGADVRYVVLDPGQTGLVRMAALPPPQGLSIDAPEEGEEYRLYALARGGRVWTWVDLDEATGKLKPVDQVTLALAQASADQVRTAARSRTIRLMREAGVLCGRGEEEAAAAKYIEAHNIEPHELYPWKIAECYARGGDLINAIAYLHYHREHYSDSSNGIAVARRLAELEGKLPQNPQTAGKVTDAQRDAARHLERQWREEEARRLVAGGGIELRNDLLSPPARDEPVAGGAAAERGPAPDESEKIVAEALEPATSGEEVVEELERTRLASEAMQKADDLYRRKMYDEAFAQYDRAFTLDARPHALIGKAQCHQALNRRDEAIAAYQAYLRALPAAADRTSIEAVISSLRYPGRAPPASADTGSAGGSAEARAAAGEPAAAEPAAVSTEPADSPPAPAEDTVALLVQRHTTTPDRYGFTYLDDVNVADAGDLDGAIVVVGPSDDFLSDNVREQLQGERTDRVLLNRRHIFIPVDGRHQPRETLKALGIPASMLGRTVRRRTALEGTLQSYVPAHGIFRISKKAHGSWKATSYSPVGFHVIRTPAQAEMHIADASDNTLMVIVPSNMPELDELVGQLRNSFVRVHAEGRLPRVGKKKIEQLVLIEGGHIPEWSDADPRWLRLNDLLGREAPPHFVFAHGPRNRRTYDPVSIEWYTDDFIPIAGSLVGAATVQAAPAPTAASPSAGTVLAVGKRFLAEACPAGGPCDDEKLESAEIRFRLLVTSTDQSIRCDAYEGLARVFVARQLHPLAGLFLKFMVLDEDPMRPDAWALLGDIDLHDGLISAAVSNYQRVVELRPDDAAAVERLADMYRKESDQNAKRKTDAIAAYWHAAGLWRAQGKKDDATRAERAIGELGDTIPPAGIPAWEPLTPIAEEQFNQAVVDYVVATRREGRLDFVRLARAEATLRRMQVPQGTALARRRLDALAHIHYQRKEYDAAIELLKQVVDGYPEEMESLKFLGRAYFDAQKFEDAATTFRTYAEKTNDPPGYDALGVALGKLGKNAEAATVYRKAAELWRQRGKNANARKAEAAARALEPASAEASAGRPAPIPPVAAPETPEAMLKHARRLRRQGRLADARPVYQKYAELQPTADAQAHFEYGEVLERLNAHPEALAAYGSCLQIETAAQQPAAAPGGTGMTLSEGAGTPLARRCRAAIERLTPASAPAPTGQRLFPLRRHIVALTPDNYRTAWRQPMTVFVTRVFAQEDFRRMVNGESLPGPRGNSSGIGVINWDDPKGREVAAHLGIASLVPGLEYFEYTFVGKIGDGGNFEGGYQEGAGNALEVGQLIARQPDERGYRFVTAANADREIGPTDEFVAIVGDPAAYDGFLRTQRDLGEDEARLGKKPQHFWFVDDPNNRADLTILRRYGITETPTGSAPVVYQCKKEAGRWKAKRYEPPIVTAHSPRDLRTYVFDTAQTVLYVVGPTAGPSSAETKELLKALEREIRRGRLTVEGKKVDRIVVMHDEELTDIFPDRTANHTYQLVTEVAHSRPFVALSVSEHGGRLLHHPIPFDTIPGNVVPVE